MVVLANLLGFDGSPESLRELQLEYVAEIGRAWGKYRGADRHPVEGEPQCVWSWVLRHCCS